MLRSTRPLLSASARGLPKTPASIAPFATSHTRKSASTIATTTWRATVPAPSSSKQLVPLIQRAQFAAKNKPDTDFEKEVAQKKLESHPEKVTSESSVRPSYEGPELRPDDPNTSEGVKKDVSVPPIAYKLGLAGTLPYLGTSLATVYLSWDMNAEWPSQSQFLNHIMMSHENATHYLHLLEPIQIGYGAIILSFLGAIHWVFPNESALAADNLVMQGMEFAEKHPNKARSTFRYGLGVLAPAVAWPTMLMPVHYALIAQFSAFTFMYFADARATTRAWTPTWYGTYRFVLTAIVGASIFISLIGREKIGPDQPRLTDLREKFHKEGHDTLAEEKWQKMEAKELEKNRKKKEEEEKKQKEEEEKQKKEEKKGKKGEKKEDKDGGNDKKDGGKDEGKKDEGKKDEGKKDEGKKDEGKKDEGKKNDAKEGGDKKEKESGDKKNEGSEKKDGGDEKKDKGGEVKKEDKKDDKSE
ncbi:hypothetical protein VM1G_03083 [Cytospora mali]|uniref:Mitochondrial inner membrane protein 1 n=1 Tax=Cytospora mali TaxID=578113 RepID=A0A194VUY1_CYTMA|nr:hypothetical protein VM1G_03083 [Valsa mali]